MLRGHDAVLWTARLGTGSRVRRMRLGLGVKPRFVLASPCRHHPRRPRVMLPGAVEVDPQSEGAALDSGWTCRRRLVRAVLVFRGWR